jgi:hypothetical protein
VLILSLDQNGERPGSGADTSPDADVAPSVYGWSLSYSKGIYAERVKPDCLRGNGNRTVRGGDRQVGMGSRRKRMSCCNGADRGSKFAPTSKGADFRVVFDHEKA